MKTDYKTGERVTIIAPGQFSGYNGEVLENETNSKRSPLKIKLDDNLGAWYFLHTEVRPISNVRQLQPTEAIKPKETGIVSTEKIKDVRSAEKRPYTKRGSKPVDDKPKRKYTRKPKTI